jgi:hypothetical protein
MAVSCLTCLHATGWHEHRGETRGRCVCPVSEMRLPSSVRVLQERYPLLPRTVVTPDMGADCACWRKKT